MSKLSLSLFSILLATAFNTTIVQAETLEDIFPRDMTDTIGVYPLSFKDTDSGCQCQYVIKNTTDSTLNRFRVNVTVHNEEGDFDCDVGVAGDKVDPGEIQKLSNMAVGKQCGQVKEVEWFYVDRCELTGKSNVDCDDYDFVLMPYNKITWMQD